MYAVRYKDDFSLLTWRKAGSSTQRG